jgi:hypothetical protein
MLKNKDTIKTNKVELEGKHIFIDPGKKNIIYYDG